MEAIERIAIIGAGNLGRALARGVVAASLFTPDQITLTRRRKDKLAPLAEEGFRTSSENEQTAAEANLIVLAVLPQQLDGVLDQLKAVLNANHLVVSLVSSVSIAEIRAKLNAEVPIVRAMPNTAIAIRESMTCIAGDTQSDKHLPLVRTLFDAVGQTIQINEGQMTSATALCACGIAFFLRAIRAASQGGNEIDFHSGEALKMAAQTARGAASLLLAHNSHPEEEIDKVTSPKGCTIAGLNQMEHHGFSSAFIKGIVTSADKAGRLYADD